jgi:hypothetical protein
LEITHIGSSAGELARRQMILEMLKVTAVSDPSEASPTSSAGPSAAADTKTPPRPATTPGKHSPNSELDLLLEY